MHGGFCLGLTGVWLLAWTMSSPAQAAGQHRANGEYGFTVDFPSGMSVCENGSWNHAHGWGVPLDGTCARSGRAISVLANYNADFSTTAEDATGCSETDLSKGAHLAIGFPGRRSITCREDHPDGTILVTVMTQAGTWPRQRAEPAEQTPWINYEAVLSTTRRTLAADTETFRHVLSTVRLQPPGSQPAPGR